ncbi:MAG: sulfotransferase family 2 domain-containing protein [Gammaproteobacteria bacterium]
MRLKNLFNRKEMNSGPSKLHFMHIPKTGGSSLSSFLERQFPLKDLCPAHYLHSKPLLGWVQPEHVFENLTPGLIKQYQFFRGHLGWLPRTYFSDAQIETITFMRHPIEHLLSVYNHISGSENDFKLSFNKWKNFQEFIFDPAMENYLSNMQTQHFCADHYVKNDTLLTQSLADIVGTWAFDINLSKEKQLALALSRLEQCRFIGIKEDYDASFQALCRQYNWLMPDKVPTLNIRKNHLKRSDLSKEVLDRIEQLTQLDTSLYNKAVGIAKARNKKPFFGFKKSPAAKLENKIHFSFADKIIGEGWHHREVSGNDAFCWSISTSPSLIFYVKPNSSYDISIHILHSMLGSLNDITLVVNNHPVNLSYMDGNILVGCIPANLISTDGKLALKFNTPIVKADGDTRELGFACKLIEIQPRVKIIAKPEPLTLRFRKAVQYFKK